MIDLHPGDLLGPAGGLALLMHYDGMTREQAYDLIAERASAPAFQAVIAQFHATTEGRALLADASNAWDRAGLPCPWDCWLDLTPA